MWSLLYTGVPPCAAPSAWELPTQYCLFWLHSHACAESDHSPLSTPSLFLLKYARAFPQPSQDSDTERFNSVIIHNVCNRTPTSHTFLIRFPVESWSFISNANWNCCHNHTGMVLGSGLIHYYHCLNVLIGNLWEFFFSFLCTLPLGRRLGWRALRELYWYEEQDGYIL